MIDRPLSARCARCVQLAPARHLVDNVTVCASCLRELLAMDRDLRIAPLPKRAALGVVFALVIGVASFTYAAETPNAERRCDEATDGARAGEDLTARIARLETQLRLSRAELAVRRGRR